MSLLDQIDQDNIPSHVAIIMDGNGRWAKAKGRPRVFGHKEGVESVRALVKACRNAKVKYLTLYAFSTENWNRPQFEVNALMEILVRSLRKETAELRQNGVKIGVIGNVDSLPSVARRELNEAMRITEENEELNLILALSYSGRWDIAEAAKKIAAKAASGQIKPEDINEALFAQHLSTSGMPDPELMIRTSGETRISNFMLWQNAYSEWYFTPTLWPDFREEQFYQAVLEFQHRERRFGKTSEQIQVKPG
ncbi:MAG: undecaprenyl diphosphate synthase [Limisphaerales bacterium]|jgi:undecaprenyl diphosphate synthase